MYWFNPDMIKQIAKQHTPEFWQSMQLQYEQNDRQTFFDEHHEDHILHDFLNIEDHLDDAYDQLSNQERSDLYAVFVNECISHVDPNHIRFAQTHEEVILFFERAVIQVLSAEFTSKYIFHKSIRAEIETILFKPFTWKESGIAGIHFRRHKRAHQIGELCVISKTSSYQPNPNAKHIVQMLHEAYDRTMNFGRKIGLSDAELDQLIKPHV